MKVSCPDKCRRKCWNSAQNILKVLTEEWLACTEDPKRENIGCVKSCHPGDKGIDFCWTYGSVDRYLSIHLGSICVGAGVLLIRYSLAFRDW